MLTCDSPIVRRPDLAERGFDLTARLHLSTNHGATFFIVHRAFVKLQAYEPIAVQARGRSREKCGVSGRWPLRHAISLVR